jgi:hypothetical protein
MEKMTEIRGLTFGVLQIIVLKSPSITLQVSFPTKTFELSLKPNPDIVRRVPPV